MMELLKLVWCGLRWTLSGAVLHVFTRLCVGLQMIGKITCIWWKYIFVYTVYPVLWGTLADNCSYTEGITGSYLRLEQTKVLWRKYEIFSFVPYDGSNPSDEEYVKFVLLKEGWDGLQTDWRKCGDAAIDGWWKLQSSETRVSCFRWYHAELRAQRGKYSPLVWSRKDI